MNRIVLGLAIANYGLVGLTALFGLLSDPPTSPDRLDGYFTHHFLLGLFTTLFTMFAQCLVFTYFLGTSRWVKETTAAYGMPDRWRQRGQRLRARALAMVMLAVLLVVGAVATGPPVQTRRASIWLHRIAVAAAYSFMIYAYKVQIESIAEHVKLTDDIMTEVNARRAQALSQAVR